MPRCRLCGADHAACGATPSLAYPPTDLMLMPQPTNKTLWRSSKRLYLDKDGAVVKDPKKQEPVKLLVAANGEIPLAQAQALGLVTEKLPEGVPAPFQVPNLGDATVAELTRAGLYEAAKLKAASDEELLAVAGVDETVLGVIRTHVGA